MTSLKIKLLLTSSILLFSLPVLRSQSQNGSGEINIDVKDLVNQGDSLLSHNPPGAAEFYLLAFSKLAQTQDPLLKAEVLDKLGQASFLMGSYTDALGSMKKALKIYEELGKDTLAAKELSWIGSTYYFSDLKELDKALDYFQRAYKRFQKVGMHQNAQLSANYSAYIYWAKGQKEKALQLHQRVLAVFDSLGNIEGQAVSQSDVGFTLNSLGRYEEGLAGNLKALQLAVQVGDSLIIVPVLGNIAISYMKLGRLNEAEEFAKMSLEAAKRRGLLLRIKEALATLHETYALMGNFNKAYSTHKEFKAISDSILNEEEVKKLVRLEERQTFEEKENQLKIEQAKKDALAEARLKRQIAYRNNLIAIIFLLLALTFLIIRNVRLKNKSAKALGLKNQELSQSNQKIENQNRDLVIHQKALEEKNIELEQLLRELKETQAKLVQYEKLDALGVVVTGVAHEINNPLNFIQGGVYALEGIISNMDMNGDKETAELLIQHISTGVGRVNEIVSELNSFNINSQREDHIVCHIHKILESCLIILQPKIEEVGCAMITNYANENLCVEAHEGSLHQVFSNLIYNSILAVSHDGIIEITTRQLDDNSIEIEVKDNGCGMKPEILDKAFDPFYTTREAGKGTGLGLYISYKLINSHNGTVRLTSEPEVGTIATVRLP